MKHTIVLAAMLLAFAPLVAAASPSVRPLYLPPGATIEPEGKSVLMMSRQGIVAATIEYDGARQRVAIWRNGNRKVLDMVDQSDGGTPFQTLGALAPDGTLYVNNGNIGDVAMRVSYRTLVYQGDSWHEYTYPHCDLSGDTGDPIVQAIDGGRLAVTFLSPESVDLDKAAAGVDAPNAAIIDETGCRVIGRANLLAIRGDYAVGFRGYWGKALGPTNVNVQDQTFKVVRWDGHSLSELGEGVAFGVESNGVSVGASAPTGDENVIMTVTRGPAGTSSNIHQFGIPYAELWDTAGSGLMLPSKARSVAYAIDENGRVAGMLRDEDGNHYAFLWQQGYLQRLDDLVQAPRWRFESAYGFTPDGGIIGIGTHDGIATAFIVYV